VDQGLAQGVVGEQEDQGPSHRGHVRRVEVEGGVAGDLRQGARIAEGGGAAGGEGLEDRQAEPLIEGWKDQQGGVPVQEGQLRVVDGQAHAAVRQPQLLDQVALGPVEALGAGADQMEVRERGDETREGPEERLEALVPAALPDVQDVAARNGDLLALPRQ